MNKNIIKDIEKMIALQDEIITEYNRLREKRTNAQLNKDKFTPTDQAHYTLLEHLVNIIIG